MSNTYWLNGKYVQKEDAYLSPLTHTLHYGLGAFEGVRSYEAKNGEVNIFRLKEHTERLFESAKIINVPIEFSFDEVMAAQLGVISKSRLKDAYIRPLIFDFVIKLFGNCRVNEETITSMPFSNVSAPNTDGHSQHETIKCDFIPSISSPSFSSFR